MKVGFEPFYKVGPVFQSSYTIIILQQTHYQK